MAKDDRFLNFIIALFEGDGDGARLLTTFERSRVYVSVCIREAICTWKCDTFLQSLVKFRIDRRSLISSYVPLSLLF